MEDMILSANLTSRVKPNVVNVLSEEAIKDIKDIYQMLLDFIVTVGDTTLMERSENTVVDTGNSIVFTSLLKSGGLDLTYFGPEDADFKIDNGKDIDSAYNLISTIYESLVVPSNTYKLLIIENYENIFSEVEKTKLLDYAINNGIYVVVD